MSRLDVAIVEDDETLRLALGDLLRSSGYRVVLYRSADEFLAEANRATLCGVLADIQMAGATGLDLASIVTSDSPKLPVILLTARPDASCEEEASAAGAAALLRKPFDPDALLALIDLHFA